MSQREFLAAIGPVMHDLERDHPGLLRVAEELVDSSWNAHLWSSTGVGIGISLSDSDSGAGAIAAAADYVQEAAIEALWFEGKSAAWPSCPVHPDTHPLTPRVVQAVASWCCPKTREVVAGIGS